MSSIFGGSKSKQQSQSQQTSSASSSNQAYPWAQQTYSPVAQQGNSAIDLVSRLLSGGSEGDAAYNSYLDSTGYRNTIDTGSQAITNNRAARGLLGSGSTLKKLTEFGQDNAQKYFTDYISKLLGLGGAGLQAGNLITGAGNVSQSSSQGTSSSSGSSSGSSGGLGGFLGSALTTLAPIIASDPRLKTDVREIGNNDGLNVYEYRYIWDEPDVVRRGYMADEVAVFNPEALGPVIDGYMTVDYSKLPAIEEV